MAAFGLLSACEQSNFFTPDDVSAPGLDTQGTNVDPMLVGHRLMEAREYELALKSYFRAAGRQGLTAQILASIGTANFHLARLNQAEDNLRQALSLDNRYVPAWNNLGAVLMETGQWGESVTVLKTAFALDSGESAEIRQNLQLALANLEIASYSEPEEAAFDLIRRGTGDYLLMSTQ